MKAVIIFHSVCGNCYHIGKSFNNAFSEQEIKVSLLRVKDDDLQIRAAKFPVSEKYYQLISSIPVATPDIMIANDIIVIGSPTYYYNVSAEIKSFLDLSVPFYVTKKLSGKIFGAYTAASTVVGGGVKCLEALSLFARQMGMIHLPVPIDMQNEQDLAPDGFIHHSGIDSNQYLNEKQESSINAYVDFLIKAAKKYNCREK